MRSAPVGSGVRAYDLQQQKLGKRGGSLRSSKGASRSALEARQPLTRRVQSTRALRSGSRVMRHSSSNTIVARSACVKAGHSGIAGLSGRPCRANEIQVSAIRAASSRAPVNVISRA
jgi:hypothetical protein